MQFFKVNTLSYFEQNNIYFTTPCKGKNNQVKKLEVLLTYNTLFMASPSDSTLRKRRRIKHESMKLKLRLVGQARARSLKQ